MRAGRVMRLALALTALGAFAAACDGERGPATRVAGSGAPRDRPECRVIYPPPPGFLPEESDRVPQGEWIGVRESFLDSRGRELHLTAGTSGEFGEGARVMGTVPIALGAEGTLLGEGAGWLVRWETPPPCDLHTIGVNGVDRDGFMAILRRMGALGDEGRGRPEPGVGCGGWAPSAAIRSSSRSSW